MQWTQSQPDGPATSIPLDLIGRGSRRAFGYATPSPAAETQAPAPASGTHAPAPASETQAPAPASDAVAARLDAARARLRASVAPLQAGSPTGIGPEPGSKAVRWSDGRDEDQPAAAVHATPSATPSVPPAAKEVTWWDAPPADDDPPPL